MCLRGEIIFSNDMRQIYKLEPQQDGNLVE